MITPQAWASHMSSLETMAAKLPSDDEGAQHQDIARGRLFRIKSVASALATSTDRAKMMSKWRSRNRDLWDASKAAPAAAEQAGAVDRQSGGDDAVQKDIDDLQRTAARPKAARVKIARYTAPAPPR